MAVGNYGNALSTTVDVVVDIGCFQLSPGCFGIFRVCLQEESSRRIPEKTR
jgi:hypothetical protein